MLFLSRLGGAERTGWKEGAQACVISRQTGGSGWAVAGYSAGFFGLFLGVAVVAFLLAIPHMYIVHVRAKTQPAKYKRNIIFL